MRITNRCLHTFLNELVVMSLIREDGDNREPLEAEGIIREVFTNKDNEMTFVVIQTKNKLHTRIKLSRQNRLILKQINIKSDNTKMLWMLEHDIE